MHTVAGNPVVYDRRSAVKRFVLLALLTVVLLSGQARAMSTEEMIEQQAQALDLEDLLRSVQEYSPEISWSLTPDLDKGIKDIVETGNKSIDSVIQSALQSGVLLLVIVLLSGVADSISGGTVGKGLQAVPIASALAVTMVAVSDTSGLIGLGTDLIEKMEMFSKTLLPTMAAVTAASGSPAAAAARQLAAMLFSDVLMSLINRFLLPIVYAYIAVSTAYAAIGNEGLKRIAGTLKWVVTSVLTTVLLSFVGYLSVSGVIAGTTDAVTLKATKFTVSSVVPVVGSILSDAAETVLVGAGMLKSTVGVFGMLAVLGMCIVPFLQLGIHYLTYKMIAALSATVVNSRTAGLIDGIGSAFGLVLGMTGACALLLLISLFTSVKVAGL